MYELWLSHLFYIVSLPLQSCYYAWFVFFIFSCFIAVIYINKRNSFGPIILITPWFSAHIKYKNIRMFVNVLLIYKLLFCHLQTYLNHLYTEFSIFSHYIFAPMFTIFPLTNFPSPLLQDFYVFPKYHTYLIYDMYIHWHTNFPSF